MTADVSTFIASAMLANDRLAALALLLDAEQTGRDLSVDLLKAATELLQHAVVLDQVDVIEPHQRLADLGQIRTAAWANGRLLDGASPRWDEASPSLLMAAGDAVAMLPQVFHDRIVPALDDVADRLSRRDAAFLNLGSGVATLALGMATLWPALRIVGIEPLDLARRIAQRRIVNADLAERIELRGGRAEDMTEVGAFDLAWLPAMFFPKISMAPALAQAAKALRPGGWLVLPVMNATAPEERQAQIRFRIASFGGCALTPDEAWRLGQPAGFAEQRLVLTMPSAPVCFAALRTDEQR